MSTIKGRTYSSPKNINLKQGGLRFDVAKSSNPFSNDSNGWGLYINASDELVYWNGTGTATVGASGSGGTPTWETIFGADNTFTITPDATWTIAGNRASATDVVTMTNIGGGSGIVLQIDNSGTGADIAGTAGWNITKAGVITCTGLTFGGANTITSTGDITWTLKDNDANALTMGASGATDMLIFLTTNGSEACVFGNDMTLTDGLFTATSTSNTAPLLLMQNDTMTTFGTSGTEDEAAFVFSSDSITTASLLQLQLSDTALAGGFYLNCLETDGGASVFSVGEDGLVVIAGDATGTDAITISAGDVTLTDGDFTMTDGNALLTLGNLTLTAGNIINTLGDLTLTAGDFLMTIGDATITDGSLTLTDADNANSITVVNNTITTADLADVSSTSISDGSVLKLNANATAHDGDVLEVISAGDATSTPQGISVTIADVTTGAAKGITVTMAKATTAAIGLSIDMAALTTGTGALITSAGTIVTTGELLSLVGDAATTCTGLLRASGTALTDGWVAQLTGGGATVTSSGGVLDVVAGAATDGYGVRIVTSGVYDGTVGVLAVSATAATTGNIVVIDGTGLTSGTGLLINTTTATLTSGFYIECNDAAATDFSVGDDGVVVIAGTATGTDSLTLTEGDITVTDGDVTMTAGDLLLTAGNITLTAGTIVETAQAISNANTAISVTHGVTKIANNASSTHTLADGVEGQRKTIICTVYVGDAVITPTNLANGGTLTLNAVGDGCTLVFLGTEWWVETLYQGAVIA